MACTPFNPAAGLFINTIPFSPSPSSGSWSFSYDRDQGGFKVYQLTYSGALKDELFLPGTGDVSVNWKYFGNYLWVLHASIGVAATTYRLFVYTLDSSAASLTSNELTGGPYTSSASSPQFHLFPSQDGELYYIWLPGNAANASIPTGFIVRATTTSFAPMALKPSWPRGRRGSPATSMWKSYSAVMFTSDASYRWANARFRRRRASSRSGGGRASHHGKQHAGVHHR